MQFRVVQFGFAACLSTCSRVAFVSLFAYVLCLLVGLVGWLAACCLHL